MSTSMYEASALSVWFDPDNMWVSLSDGRQLSIPLTFFPRLLQASPREREVFEISGGGTGLHWNALDEDISVKGLLKGCSDQTNFSKSPTPISH